MFEVGEAVRINEGRFYGSIGRVVSVNHVAMFGTMYTVRCSAGTVEVASVLSTFANNGD